MNEVLDTRFFAVHLTSSDPALQKKTRDRLLALRRDRRGLLPSVVIAETVNLICRALGRRPAEEEHRKLLQSGLKVVPVDADLAKTAGILRCQHRQVPLADCMIAAVAIRESATVISDDPHFEEVSGLRVAWL